MGVIYKITNLINNKIYIGQTVVSEPVRWQQHIFYAYNDPTQDCVLLCNAIKKYGRENFKREILERVSNEQLNEREIYYIELYNSTDRKKGYNIEIGGNGHTKFSDEEIKDLFSKLKSVPLVANELGASRSAILKRIKSMDLYFLPTTVFQYDIKGNLINIYDCFAQAARETKLNLPRIIPSNHYSCGYIWIYKKDDLNINEVLNNFRNNKQIIKPIEQYDLEGNYIRQWKSANAASIELKINVSSIKSAVRGDQLTAGNFIWVRLDGEDSFEKKYEKYLLSSKCCEIEEIDKNGNIVKKYKSSGQAEKELGFSYNEIKKVCDGKKEKARDRYFRYSNGQKRELIKWLI